MEKKLEFPNYVIKVGDRQGMIYLEVNEQPVLLMVPLQVDELIEALHLAKAEANTDWRT